MNGFEGPRPNSSAINPKGSLEDSGVVAVKNEEIAYDTILHSSLSPEAESTSIHTLDTLEQGYHAMFSALVDKTSSYAQLAEFCHRLQGPEERNKRVPERTPEEKSAAILYDTYARTPDMINATLLLSQLKTERRNLRREFEISRQEGQSYVHEEYIHTQANLEQQTIPHLLNSADWQAHLARSILTNNQLRHLQDSEVECDTRELLGNIQGMALKKGSPEALKEVRLGLIGAIGTVWGVNALISSAEQHQEKLIITPTSPAVDVNYATDLFVVRGKSLYLVQIKTEYAEDAEEVTVTVADPYEEQRQYEANPSTTEYSRAQNTAFRMEKLQTAMCQSDSSYQYLDLIPLMMYVRYPSGSFPALRSDWSENRVDLRASLKGALPEKSGRRKR